MRSATIALIGAAGLVWASAAVAEEAAQKSVKSASIAKPAVVRKTSVPLVETGVASVYCFRNGPTASGERSRPAVLTAAHKTLPFGTLVEVTNRQNGRSVVVRINDRGPFVEGRIIDLTPAAARALKFDGLANVTVRVLDHQRDLRIVARAI